jgi:hypothetical protein
MEPFYYKAVQQISTIICLKKKIGALYKLYLHTQIINKYEKNQDDEASFFGFHAHHGIHGIVQ